MCLIFNSPRRRLTALLFCSLGYVPVLHAQQPASAASASTLQAGNACSNPSAEAQLRQRETAVLGAAHAADHAAARAVQCRMASGQEAKPSPDATLMAAARTKPTNTSGLWGTAFTIPVPGITAVLLNNGKVLFWSYDPQNYGNPTSSNTGIAYIWDSNSKVGYSITPPENIWCGGQTILADGRVYVAGGNLRYPNPNAPAGTTGYEGTLTHYLFNPGNESWARQYPDMSVGRWYPTTTQLPDNRVVITSGFDQTGSQAITQAVELFTPDVANTISEIGTHDPTGLYPFQYLLPTLSSGQVQMLQAGPNLANSALLTANTWGWSNTSAMLNQHYGYGNGITYTDASVSPNKQTVMIAGGENGTTAVKLNEWLDGFQPAAGWKPFPQWNWARHNSNTVILPDGTLFTVGGNGANTSYDNPVWQTELYNKPATDTTGAWVEMAPISIPAAYHSSAILLPDATVLLSEDDRDPSKASSHRAQIYSPPYLFKGGARPQITSVPTTLTKGQQFAIGTDARTVTTVMLIAPGAVTHGNDMHQRAIKLATQGNGSNLKATVPSSGAIVPPGYYMLFVVDNNGVPSVAKFVRIS
jgi:hypothetical protein